MHLVFSISAYNVCAYDDIIALLPENGFYQSINPEFEIKLALIWLVILQGFSSFYTLQKKNSTIWNMGHYRPTNHSHTYLLGQTLRLWKEVTLNSGHFLVAIGYLFALPLYDEERSGTTYELIQRLIC
jgi:hypothetical protein